MTGQVQDIVYEGTDTIFRLVLPGGESLRIREQNRDGARPRFAIGDVASVTLPPEFIRVLTI